MEKIIFCPSCRQHMHASPAEDDICLKKTQSQTFAIHIGLLFMASTVIGLAERFICTEIALIVPIAVVILNYVFSNKTSPLQKTTSRELLISETIDSIASFYKRPAPNILVSSSRYSPAGCKLNSIILPSRFLEERAASNEEIRVTLAHEMAHWHNRDPETGLLVQAVTAVALYGIAQTKSLPMIIVSEMISKIAIGVYKFWRESEADLQGIAHLNDGYSLFLQLKGTSRIDSNFVAKRTLLPMIALASVSSVGGVGSGVLGGYPTMGQQLTFVLQHNELPRFWLSRLAIMISTPQTGDYATLKKHEKFLLSLINLPRGLNWELI